MELFKIVRESIGYKPKKMSDLLKKRSVQAYLKAERTAKRITLNDIISLQEIYPGNLNQFWELLKKVAE